MKRLRKFLSLPGPDRCLLIQAGILLGAIRVGLWLLPFSTLRQLLASIAHRRAGAPPADVARIEKVVWAVLVASHSLSRVGTCLTQALATQVLLVRRGHPACVRIGVARSATGQLQAHAWVESRGKVVIGAPEDLSCYALLPPLETSGR